MISLLKSRSEGLEKCLDDIRLARWIRDRQPSALQRMLQADKPDLISFALGLPAPELFPYEACARATENVLNGGNSVLQYAPPLSALKSHVVELMRARGVHCTGDQVFLTAGAQQGMSLLTRLIVQQHGKVLVDEFTYTGFLQAVAPFEPQLVTVPVRPDAGMDVEALEWVLKRSAPPALIYAMPEGHNPLGARLSYESRFRLTELAARYKVPIIEDDAYGFLSYDDQQPPPLRALDDKWVLYVGSFAKILAPSFRVGWIVAPPALISKLSIIKEATDINTCPLSQRVVAAYLEQGGLPGHLARLRTQYRRRRDAMAERITELLHGAATFAIPPSGVFLWLELSGIKDSSRLLEFALEFENVTFLPGSAFAVNGRASGAVRLNFSHPGVPEIQEGIQRLARAVRAFSQR